MSFRQNAPLLVMMVGILGIAGQWADDVAFTRLWQLPLALLLLGLAYELWMVQRTHLAVAIEGSARGFLGRSLSVAYKYSHALARDILIEFGPSGPESFELVPDVRTMTIGANGQGVFNMQATPRRLGRYSWPEPRVRVGGVLGLAWWSRKLSAPYEVEVAPEVLDDVTRRHGAAQAGTKTRQVQGFGAEILQLRDYVPGDPQHFIDWKASARSGRFVSRDFSEDQHLEIVIAIDAGRSSGLRAGDMDRLGHYANVAARFAEHAIQQDDRIGLMIYADRPLVVFPPLRGAGGVIKIRRALTSMKVAQAESNPLNAAVRIRTLVKQRSLVVMLTDLDDATVASQLASAARLLLPKHLPLIAGLASPEAEALASAQARDWLDPYESLAAQEYCGHLAANVAALRALGAPALIARPQQLERAVLSTYAEFRLRRKV
jgi:uncharacterized protein (DUF58 family)